MNPVDLMFKSYLEKGETIYYVAHTHILTEWKYFLKISFLGIFIPVVFYFIFPPLKPFWVIWVGIGLLKFIYEFLDWYYDTWLITNLSVIDIIWEGFFNQSSTRIEYPAIKGVSYKIKGFWKTILGIGNVSLELTTNNAVLLENAANPKRIERAILDTQAEFMGNKEKDDHETLKNMLITMMKRQKMHEMDDDK